MNYDFTNIPQQLKDENRWVLWKRETTKEGAPTKRPYQPSGVRAKSNDPSTWTSYGRAIDAFRENRFDGIGFMFGRSQTNPQVNYAGVDLDKHYTQVIDGQHPEFVGLAQYAFELFKDTYIEFSPSGTGLHILMIGEKPSAQHCKTDLELNPDGTQQVVEIYDNTRYFTMTGRRLSVGATTLSDCTEQLKEFYYSIWPPQQQQQRTRPNPSTTTLDDQRIIVLAGASLIGAKFNKLLAGDTSDYPLNQDKDDYSAADLAFCNYLAFYTDDPAQIDRIVRSSGLMREKWNRYGERTIRKALDDFRGDRYTPPRTHKTALDDDVGASAGESPSDNQDGASKTTDDNGYQFDDEIKYTDGWRAKQLAKLHGRDMCWLSSREKWLIWDGKRFEFDELDQATRNARSIKDNILAEAKALAELGDYKGADLIRNEARKMDSRDKYSAMLSLAHSEPGIAVKQEWLDNQPMLLNVENGTVDLKTGDLLVHDRDHLLTKLAPVSYDETATCPQWTGFLYQIMNDNETLVQFLQRAVGYALTASIREAVLLILHGTGANGKTTFLETIARMLGDYARHSPENLLVQIPYDKHPAGLASLMGTRFVVHPELDKDVNLDEGLVKRVTGGDTLTARFMRQDFFDFQPTHKIFVPANELPEITGTDHGIWRRVRNVPFEVLIPDEQQIPLEEMLARFEAERSGILRWAIDGCLMWQEKGLGFPQEIKQATDAYREDSDIIGRFIDDHLIVEWNAEVQASKLYGAFKSWCEQNSEVPMSQTKFGRRMKSKDFKKERGRSGVVYMGLGFRETLL